MVELYYTIQAKSYIKLTFYPLGV